MGTKNIIKPFHLFPFYDTDSIQLVEDEEIRLVWFQKKITINYSYQFNAGGNSE